MRAVVYLLFLLSGATGLVYEVAWTRRLVLILGSTSRAVSLILAAYMLGLALGAHLLGRRADGVRRPLRIYAGLEAGVGLLAFLFPLLLAGAESLGLVFGGRSASFVTCFVVLLLPTILMGGTLPILARFVVTRMERLGGQVGLLYSLNTLGAVAGTFLSGFVLVEWLGVYGSTFLAGAVNLGIAGAAWGLAARRGRREKAEEGGGGPAVAPPSAPADEGAMARGKRTPRTGRAGLAPSAAFAAGFLSLGSEVLWTRMLTFFLEGFTWTFAAMLTTFLLGLALGTMVSGALVNRLRDLRRYTADLFLLSAIVSAGVLFALTHHYTISKVAKDVTAPWFANWRYHHAASLFLGSFVVLFPPALVMGAIFPAVARMATRRLGEVGRKVGLVYAVNTAGAVLGSLIAGLVLIPTAGMAWGATGLAGGALLAGVALHSGRARFVGIPALVVMAVVVWYARPDVEMIRHSHVFFGERGLERELRDYEEGATAAVSVVEDVRNGVKAIYTDEFQAAATGPHYKYMRMLAHLPLLLAPAWDGADVCVICFGTGTTAGSASVHPLGRLDLVEISPEVIDQAPRFEDVNKGVLDPEKEHAFPVDLHVDDGRNFLLTSRDRRWDVITLEPLMPYTPGAVNLYTKDFYELCRERLKPGGVMCQWIPIHAMSSDDYRMLVKSFVDVFPDSTLWFVEETSLVIGTTDGSEKIPYLRLLERMRRSGVLDDLRSIEYDDPLLVLNTFVAGGEDLRRAVADAETMTDEHPWMEFRPAPYGWPNTFAADNMALFYHTRRPIYPSLDLQGVAPADREKIRERLDRCYQGGQAFLEAQYKNALAGFYDAIGDRDRQAAAFRESLGAYREAVRLNPDDASARYLRDNAIYGYEISLGIADLRRGRLEAAADSFRKAAALNNPFKPDLAYTWLGRALNRMKRPAPAIAALDEALRRFPKSPDALAERGYARYLLGDLRAARDDFAVAFGERNGVEPWTDADLVAARKDVAAAAEKDLLPEAVGPRARAEDLLATLRKGEPGAQAKAAARLRLLFRDDPAAVRDALAPDVAKAKDPDATATERMFALQVFRELRDVEGMIRLLREGAPAVREKAADFLSGAPERRTVDALLDAMADPDAGVRTGAMLSFFALTGRQPGGYDPENPEAERAAALADLRTWWAAAREGFDFER